LLKILFDPETLKLLGSARHRRERCDMPHARPWLALVERSSTSATRSSTNPTFAEATSRGLDGLTPLSPAATVGRHPPIYFVPPAEVRMAESPTSHELRDRPLLEGANYLSVGQIYLRRTRSCVSRSDQSTSSPPPGPLGTTPGLISSMST